MHQCRIYHKLIKSIVSLENVIDCHDHLKKKTILFLCSYKVHINFNVNGETFIHEYNFVIGD